MLVGQIGIRKGGMTISTKALLAGFTHDGHASIKISINCVTVRAHQVESLVSHLMRNRCDLCIDTRSRINYFVAVVIIGHFLGI